VKAEAGLVEGDIVARPFVKWVGGKRQLLPELVKRLPVKFNRYYEPFLGGGALFFRVRPQKALVSDINAELINAYQVIKHDVDSLIADLQQHYYEEEYFYRIRNIDRLDEYKDWTDVQRASRLIYLNKTCYNGLYRVNSKGLFNTPFGKYKNPMIADGANLRACSRVLQAVEVVNAGFDSRALEAKRGDFVYMDPPYVPLRKTSNFTSYSKDGFDIEMQEKLYAHCCALDKKGVFFMLSNSSATFVLERYQEFNLEFLQASRAVNSVAANRGKVQEVVVRNYT